jgi:hypothetical protein
VRDFFSVDQDQSDNLPTLYLLTSKGRTAQYTKKNQAAHPLNAPGVATSATINSNALSRIIRALQPTQAEDDAADAASKSLHRSE